MARRYAALERIQRRKEKREQASSNLLAEVPPPPAPPLDPPPSGFKNPLQHRRRPNYGLQRDYRILEREKKVSSVLENAPFRAALESILQGQLEGKDRPAPTRPTPDQWLQDLGQRPPQQQGPRQPVATVASGGQVIPINDLSGVAATSRYTLAQRESRCKLAAVYRLADMFGWSQSTYNHITACSPGNEGGYLVNAFGLMYQEVTASNLVCVDLEGRVLDPGTTQLGVDAEGAGWTLHSAVHRARKDLKCIIHIYKTSTVAVSAMNCGLLQISSQAVAVGSVSYFDFLETEREDVEDEIACVLGMSKVLVLRNHGALAMGETIEESVSIAQRLVKACDVQVAAMPAGLSNISQAPAGGGGVWSKCGAGLQAHERGGVKWRPGELDFEALMRMLDSKGYRTGYSYKGLDLLRPGEDNKPKEKTEDLLRKGTHGIDAATHKTTVEKQKEELLETAALEHGASSLLETSGEDEYGLSSLQAKAEQVAKSTSDAVKKLESNEGELSPLDLASQTARRVAKSTEGARQRLVKGQEGIAEDDEPDLLEMARKTAEHVARSTGDAAGKLSSKGKEDVDASGLTRVQAIAQQVASSTSDAVRKLGQDKTPMRVGEREDLLHNPSGDTRNQHTQSPSLPQPPPPSSNHRLANGFAEAATQPSQALSNGTHSPLLHSTPKHLPSPPAPTLPLADGKTRKLPEPPLTTAPATITTSKTRMLPPLPATVRLPAGAEPKKLSNGYHLPQHVKDLRSADSDSEYSTTDSVELPQLPLVANGRASTNSHGKKQSYASESNLDHLETNPSENMASTAEMVAESTSKAMHKLTTMLPLNS